MFGLSDDKIVNSVAGCAELDLLGISVRRILPPLTLLDLSRNHCRRVFKHITANTQPMAFDSERGTMICDTFAAAAVIQDPLVHARPWRRLVDLVLEA